MQLKNCITVKWITFVVKCQTIDLMVVINGLELDTLIIKGLKTNIVNIKIM